MSMTVEERKTWEQAQRAAYQLLMSIENRRVLDAATHLQEIDLLIQHLRQIEARERRTGWEDDDG